MPRLQISIYREPLLKGKFSTVDLLVLTSSDQLLLRLKTLFTFIQNNYPYEEVNCTEPPPSVSVPCYISVLGLWFPKGVHHSQISRDSIDDYASS